MWECVPLCLLQTPRKQFNKEGGGGYLCKSVCICVAVGGEGAFVPDGVIVVTAGVMPASL